MTFFNWLLTVPLQRKYLGFLIAANFAGALYGFLWYREQLAGTNYLLWPVVPDSPLSTLLFAVTLILYLFKVRRPLLESVAYVTIVKYGLWTMLILGHYWITCRQLDFESTHLFISHGIMATEGLLFYAFHRLPAKSIPVGGAWSFFNDYMDYYHGLHPVLPVPEALPWARKLAFTLSTIVVTVLLALTLFEERVKLAQASRRD